MGLQQMFRRDQVYDFLVPKVVEDLDLSHGTVLYMEGRVGSFDGFKAINDLNFYVDAGELRCVIGPNGAGKTTMMDIITGKTRPDTGQVLVRSAHQSAEDERTGDRRSRDRPQIPEANRVRAAQRVREPRARNGWAEARVALPSVHASPGRNVNASSEVLTTIGLQDVGQRAAGALSHGQKQWLEIGMLLMQNPLLLLVDEPAAGMTHQEMDRTVELLTSLAGEHSVVVVEHDMDFVRALNSRVTVLHQGQVLAEGGMDQVQNDPRVIEVYLGA